MSKDTRLHPADEQDQYVVEKNYLLKNPQLPSRLTKIRYESWMLDEIQRCMKDILYFAENFFNIVNLDRGRIKIPLYDVQKRMLKMMVENNRIVVTAARQSGKCVENQSIIKVRYRKVPISFDISIGKFFSFCRLISGSDTKVRDVGGDIPLRDGFRKFTDIIPLANWQVETENGWEDIESINRTVPYRKFAIDMESGKRLQCADDHIVIDEFGNEVFAKDSLGRRLRTKDGFETVISVVDTGVEEPMYDLTLPEGSSHCYYTDGILSHNTTIITIFALYYTIFNNDKTVLIVANKANTAREILSRIRMAYEELPVWLKPGVTEWQKESVKFANGSRVVISSTSTSSGRSYSINCLLIDECAFIGTGTKVEEEFFTAVLPTITSSKNSKLILTSTPNGARGYFYDRLRDAMRGKSGWKYMSIPWTSIPGRDLEWYRNAMADCNNDPKVFAQEYACAFLEEGDAAFDKEYIEEMKRMAKEPSVLATEDYKVWYAPKPGHVYSMGVDVAEGVGDCASCIQILDITDLSSIHQAACYNSRTIAPTPFAKKIVDIAHQWGDPWVLVERNNMGAEVVSRLVGEPHYYPKVVAYDSTDETKAKRAGITSSTQSKYDGISNMRYYMNIMRAMDIPDMQTLVEFDTFIRWPNGTYKKSSDNGVYDDRVMAMCWALFILHTPIAQKCLTVTEVSETGKPSKIAPGSDQQNFIGIGVFSSDERKPVTLDSVFGVGVPVDGAGGMVRHSVDDMDYEELLAAGWRKA